MTETTTHYRACNLCEAICGLSIEVRNGEILSIRGDRDDPFSRGHICPKAIALQDIHNDPDRLRKPMRRVADGWVSVDWNQALDMAAGGISRVRAAHGSDAVAVYMGNPNVHNLGSLLFAPAMIRSLGTANRYSATSVDQLPHHVAAALMFGHKLLLPVPDIDRTAHFLVFGANPVVSNGSMMTAPRFKRRLEELRGRGGRLVVVDPRRTETVRIADRHCWIRPGSDALLLMAMASVIFDEGLEDRERLHHVSSVESLCEVARGFRPETVATATGIEATEIRTMARDFASAPTAVCYGRMGASTQAFGGLCQWLINALNIITGNFDRPGGAMFTTPAVDLVGRTSRGRLGHRRTRVRGLPEFGGEFPVAALAEEILTPGAGQVRALLTVAGNPVLSTPNGGRLETALKDLEFMVAIDPYLNETTRHADLILPPTSALERDHYDLVFNLLAVRNVARYSPSLFEPKRGALHDWQILEGLRRRLDDGSWWARCKRRFQAALGPRRLLDLGLRFGPYGSRWVPFSGGLSLRRLESEAHGLDLGPLESCLPEGLRTRDRRIELVPPPFLEDVARLSKYRDEVGAGDSLLLIGRRHLRSNNSWMHNHKRLMGGKERCTLLMHPEDARRLGLEKSDRVAVISRTGRVEVALEVSDEIGLGVVSLPHGWGHHRSGTRLGAANDRPGASANDLTDDLQVDELSGNAVLNGVSVRVEPVEES